MLSDCAWLQKLPMAMSVGEEEHKTKEEVGEMNEGCPPLSTLLMTESNSFLTGTTLHGSQHVGQARRHRAYRVAWLLAVLLMAGLLTHNLSHQFHRYFSYPHNTRVKVTRVSSLHFPAVTVCIQDSLDHQRLQETFPHAHELLEQFFTNRSALNWSDPHVQRVFRNVTMQQIMAAASFSAEEVVVEKRFVHSVSNESVMYETADSAFLGAHRCFTFTKSDDSKDIMMSSMDALVLQFRVPHDNLLPVTDVGSLRVTVHQPWEVPISWKSTEVAFGTSVEITMQLTEYKFLPAPYYSMGGKDCVDLLTPDTAQPDLQHFDHYTFFNCFWENVSLSLSSICNCTTSGDLGNLHLPHCSLWDIEFCTSKRRGLVLLNALSENGPCLWECQVTKVDTKATAVPFPSHRYQALRGMATDNLTAPDSVRITVSFESDVVSKTEHVPALTLEEICSKVGGEMGLFLGASLLTATELLEHVFVLLSITFKHFLRKLNIISPRGSK